MDMSNLYTELIMEHNNSKRNKRKLERATGKFKGLNPSCGDEIELEVEIENGIVKDLAYTGTGCAISQASTSIMIDLVKGRKIEDALDLSEKFISMIKREISNDEELYELEDALAFKNISNMPARVKCAVLAWHTLKNAL
ncbi:MAG: Fe-S cluster assembly sulfur transfer protein SufU [Clostridium sp.]